MRNVCASMLIVGASAIVYVENACMSQGLIRARPAEANAARMGRVGRAGGRMGRAGGCMGRAGSRMGRAGR